MNTLTHTNVYGKCTVCSSQTMAENTSLIVKMAITEIDWFGFILFNGKYAFIGYSKSKPSL